MILNFAITRNVLEELANTQTDTPVRSAVMVVKPGPEGDYIFVRNHNGESLAAGERLLQYKIQGRNISIAGGSFFFEEGLAHLYGLASFASLSADKNGKAIITGLLDNNKQRLHTKRWDSENNSLLSE